MMRKSVLGGALIYAGIVIFTNALLVCSTCVFCAPKVHCIFDQPFLLMIRYKDSEQPYFAMWVDNAEIMVKAE